LLLLGSVRLVVDRGQLVIRQVDVVVEVVVLVVVLGERVRRRRQVVAAQGSVADLEELERTRLAVAELVDLIRDPAAASSSSSGKSSPRCHSMSS